MRFLLKPPFLHKTGLKVSCLKLHLILLPRWDTCSQTNIPKHHSSVIFHAKIVTKNLSQFHHFFILVSSFFYPVSLKTGKIGFPPLFPKKRSDFDKTFNFSAISRPWISNNFISFISWNWKNTSQKMTMQCSIQSNFLIF